MASVLYSESDEESLPFFYDNPLLVCDSLSDASHSSRPKTPKASVEGLWFKYCFLKTFFCLNKRNYMI